MQKLMLDDWINMIFPNQVWSQIENMLENV